MQKSVAIVILNYMNYKDTVECVESISTLSYQTCGIVIVDNGSSNGSLKYLNEKHASSQRVYVVSSKKNVGYARGNNIGIAFARRTLGAEYVLVVNNDTIFTDSIYIDKLLAATNVKTGIVDGNIICKNQKICPRISYGTGLKELIIQIIGYFFSVLEFDKWASKLIDYGKGNGPKEGFPQGSALMFTPHFFEIYGGYYPRTFLYREEQILYIMLKRANLELGHSNVTQIYHKEDMSSKLSFKNDSKIKKKYIFQSLMIVVLVKLLPLKLIIKETKYLYK